MVRPSCADMGYTKSASDCVGKKAISCPFDTTAYYCPEVGESCDFSEYPLTECPANGNCTDFECGGTIQYKLDGCQSGYTQSGNTCIVCSFPDYSLTSCPAGGYCTRYECGGTTKYTLDSCVSGYYVNGWYDSCSPCSEACYDGSCSDPATYLDECGCYMHCCDVLNENFTLDVYCEYLEIVNGCEVPSMWACLA